MPVVFLLSFSWEYLLEPVAVELIGIGDDNESDEEKMEFVYSSVVFSFLALMPALFLLLRVRDRWQNSQEALVLAKEEAEKAIRSKSLFLANVSHELRTPLNAILGFSDSLRSGIFGTIDNTRHADYIEHIHGSGQHLLAMVNDLLDLAAAEEGKLVVADETVDINDMLKQVGDTLCPQAEERGIELSIDLAQRRLCIQGDSRRLFQIGLNLASNAVKFTPKGGRVNLNTAQTTEGFATITISDTGPGMDADAVARALQPFEHAVHAENTATDGTGLGLPLAAKLTESMGGTLRLESQLGTGTKVIVSFPLRYQ